MATTAPTEPARGAEAPGGKRITERRWPRYTALTVLAAFFLFPLLFMFAGAFKPDNTVLADGDTLRAFWPFPFSFENFGDAIDRASFPTLFQNSVIISVVTVALGLVVNSMAGYALARLPFKLGKGFLLGVIALTIIPFQAVAIPLLFMVSEWGWRDTLYVQILPFIAQPLFIYLFYSFFLAIPKSSRRRPASTGAARCARSCRWCCRWPSPPSPPSASCTSCRSGASCCGRCWSPPTRACGRCRSACRCSEPSRRSNGATSWPTRP